MADYTDDRFKDFKTTQGAYAAPTPAVNAVGRAAGDPHVTGPYDLYSPSGTDWNQTFSQNNPYSPSGTDWGNTFGPNRQRMNGSGGIGSPSGTDWSKTFGRTSGRTSGALAGNTTPPPSPGDIDNTFFGGPTPTPTPTPRPSLAFYRNRLLDSDLSSRDREMYGAGSDFGFLT